MGRTNPPPTHIMCGVSGFANLPARRRLMRRRLARGDSGTDESESEDDGSADSSIGEVSDSDCPAARVAGHAGNDVRADSASAVPPNPRGACFTLEGDSVYCLAWFMCVVMWSAVELS